MLLTPPPTSKLTFCRLSQQRASVILSFVDWICARTNLLAAHCLFHHPTTRASSLPSVPVAYPNNFTHLCDLVVLGLDL